MSYVVHRIIYLYQVMSISDCDRQTDRQTDRETLDITKTTSSSVITAEVRLRERGMQCVQVLTSTH